MAELRVHEWIGGDQTDVGLDWEEESYRQGCAYARELAERHLQAYEVKCGIAYRGWRHVSETATNRWARGCMRAVPAENTTTMRDIEYVESKSGPHNSRPWATELRRLLRTAY